MHQSRHIFGTDGVRGVANVYPMTVEMAVAIGRGVAALFKNPNRRHKILIGKDTRLSGYMFENALVAGILSMGVDVKLVGPLPTPAIAFLTRSMRADAGIVISASHNPYADNGIKIFGGDGYKLPDALERTIENYVLEVVQGGDSAPRAPAEAVGKATRIDDATGRYIVFLKNAFPQPFDLTGISLAVDCAHGATYKVAPAVFTELGAEVSLVGTNPNGTNINQGVGSLHPQGVIRVVEEGRAQVGVAFDGDGDRIIMVDEDGEVVDGDQVMAICAEDLMNRGALHRATLVGTVMSNLGLEICLRERGISLLRTKVGDRCVVEAMRKGGYTLGGEQSGHIVFLEHNTTGDGILSALMVLKVMVLSGKPLKELKAIMPLVPQVLINLPVKEKLPLSQARALSGAMKVWEDKLDGRGRILVRYSGTENLLRLMVEAEDAHEMEQAAAEMKAAALKDMG